jgi:hypothetical protein
MAAPRVVFRVHAVRRMFERRITETDVRRNVGSNELIVITVCEPDPGTWDTTFRRRTR